MTALTAAAWGRIGFRIVNAGSREMARVLIDRAKLWLLVRFLPLVILAAIPAHANGVNTSIGNGDYQYGSISGSGVDTYNFNVSKTGYVIFSLSEVGTHVTGLTWTVTPITPSGTVLTPSNNGLFVANQQLVNATGTWKFQVTKGGTATGGNYALTIVHPREPYSISSPNTGLTMYDSVTYSSSVYRGSLGLYTINRTGGGATTAVTVHNNSTTSRLLYWYWTPDGVEQGNWACAVSSTCTLTLGSSQTGAYTVVISKEGHTTDDTIPYTISATGAMSLPTLAKEDGECPTCGKQADVAMSSPLNSAGQAVLGDPVNIATGNLFEKFTDYTTAGQNPLQLIRYYNSQSYTRGLFPTLIGTNWRTNYDRYLRVISSSAVTAERPDGRIINFKLVSSVWTPDTDVDVKLTNSGSTYTLTDSDDTVETYTVTSGQGKLTSIARPNGYTQTMNYTSGVLTSVSDSYSRSLSFTYTSGLLTGVTTPDSATLTYGYNTNNILNTVTYNTSPTTSQTYVYGNTNLPFCMTGITDENGNSYASWTYDGAGRVTDAQHAGSADDTQFSYDNSTGNRTVTGPLGEVDTYKFTTLQGASKINEIDRAANSPVAAATRSFTYDSNGYLATATDWNGNSTHWTNNSHGQYTSMTEGFGSAVARTTSVTYDSTWVRKPYTTTKTNVTIDDRYDATTGNLLTHTLTDTTGGSTNGQTHVWTYTYTTTGQLQTAQMPRTDATVKTTYGYTGGTLTSIADQLSHTTTINTYTGGGYPTKITDPNSVVTDLTYDNRMRLTQVTVEATPSNEVTQYGYRASGQVHVVTLPDSSTITYDYDNAQRLNKITNTAGETINYTLNNMGKPTQVQIKDSGGTVRKSYTATYDVLGDMLTLVGAAGSSQTTNFAYDGMGNRTSTTDANSKQWQQAWDALNRATTVTDPLTHTAAPTYNNLDYVTAQTDFNGYSTSFTRDAFGNAIGRTSPDSGTDSFTFDKDNNLTARTDARSVASSQTFDVVDRITALSITGYSGENTTYTYDSTTGGNKGVGRLTSISDESGSTSRVYDNFGNITQEVRVIGGKTYTTSYGYDLANRLKEIIYPSGRYVDYTYDSSGYLTTVTTKPSSGGTVTTLASSITHKPFGPLSGATYGNSEVLTKTFDNNYWLSTLNTVFSGTYVQELTYGEDNAGNLTSITDTLDSTRNETFGVDSLNRLHTASGKYGSRTYTYDNNSNRATEVAGTTTYTYSYTTSTNLLASYTDGTNTRHFTNTAAGNMATDDRTFIGGGSVVNTFGGRNRLESMTVNGQTITYKINALGQRVSMAFSGATTHYLYDLAGHLIGEANGGTGISTTEYVYMEGAPLAQIDVSSGNIYYIYDNQVNAPQKIADASRTLKWDRIQEPFGEDYSTPTNLIPTNIRFPGQYADSNNSLSYNLNRDYDKSTGRYVEADLLALNGGPNLFGYAGANPTQWLDFLGLKEVPDNTMGPLKAGDYWASSSGSWNLCMAATNDPSSCNAPNPLTYRDPTVGPPGVSADIGGATDLNANCFLKNVANELTVDGSKQMLQQLLTDNASGRAALTILEKTELPWQANIGTTVLECADGCMYQQPTTWPAGWDGAH